MRKYLLPENGSFYKANLHCHTTFSDGKKTPAEVKELYKSLGYSVVAYTDHDILIAHDELNDDGFLALHGFEMEINDPTSTNRRTCHLCFIGIDPENMTQPLWHRTKYLFGNAPSHREEVVFDDTLPDYVRAYTHEGINEIIATAQEKGFFVTYNHPTWSREGHNDYDRYDYMHAMEVFNSECEVLGHFEYNEKDYDHMLANGKRIYCVATDDTHSKEACFGGFTMIKAERLEYEAITSALIAGNFYASQGPEIHSLWIEDGMLHIECSNVKSIRFNTGIRRAKKIESCDGMLLNTAEFKVKPEDLYVRVTITDVTGKHAYTNAYFVDDLFE
jgi:hypothetical protein